MTDAPPNLPAPNPNDASKKWLYGSIALNLLLGGVLIGGGLSGFSHEHRGPHHPMPPMAVRDVGFAFMRALPEERREQLFKSAKAQFRAARPLFEESIKARKEAFALLEQETIDPPVLKAAFAKVRAADSAAQSRAGDAFVDMVATIPAAERRAAVAKMRERWAAREDMRMRSAHWDKEHDEGGEGGPPPPPPSEGFGGPPPPPPPEN